MLCMKRLSILKWISLQESSELLLISKKNPGVFNGVCPFLVGRCNACINSNGENFEYLLQHYEIEYIISSSEYLGSWYLGINLNVEQTTNICFQIGLLLKT